MKNKQIAEFRLEDGTTFLVEVDEPESHAIQRVALPSGKTVLKAQKSLEQALENLEPVASAIVSKLRNMNTPASEVEVKLGLKLTVDAGAVFASIGSEVDYEICLKWNKDSIK